jgi:ribosomal protein L37AE/L43A
MKRSSLTSRSSTLVCPFCEADELLVTDRNTGPCPSCGRVTSRLILGALRRLISLPESMGTHACECGHPEMRRLPDGVFHCPACGSEILPSVEKTAQDENFGELKIGQASHERRST